MVSMNLCLLVGLSVDYVVHLAEGYHLSAHKDRLGRVHDMLEHLGISVLSGALTTIGAAIPMMFAKIQFFLQFGTFLLSVIGFSLAFSLIFFTAVMGIIGPQEETGSLYPLCRFISRKFKRWTGLSRPNCKISQINSSIMENKCVDNLAFNEDVASTLDIIHDEQKLPEDPVINNRLGDDPLNKTVGNSKYTEKL